MCGCCKPVGAGSGTDAVERARKLAERETAKVSAGPSAAEQLIQDLTRQSTEKGKESESVLAKWLRSNAFDDAKKKLVAI